MADIELKLLMYIYLFPRAIINEPLLDYNKNQRKKLQARDLKRKSSTYLLIKILDVCGIKSSTNFPTQQSNKYILINFIQN